MLAVSRPFELSDYFPNLTKISHQHLVNISLNIALCLGAYRKPYPHYNNPIPQEIYHRESDHVLTEASDNFAIDLVNVDVGS